ncbi:hypothetical protein HYR99_36875 [Candidatus Poribacteria bacterium]|nr:hypothetical protein [Candidatus Poribacteria bacterium]
MSYPDWLVNTFIQFNHRTTCENEWDLIDIAVELHRQPDFPQRLDVLFQSLQDGFGNGVLVAGNFLALGYYDAVLSDQVFPRFITLGKKARTMLELRGEKGEDEQAAIYAFNEVSQQVKPDQMPDESHPLVIQIPYFIKHAEYYALKADISFNEFKEKFDKGEVLFTKIQQVQSEKDVQQWLAEHRPESYEQRFIFTFGLLVRNGIENTIRQEDVQGALAHLIGAFLSWAGMGVADSTRYVMAAVAAKLAHFSHEFLKPFGDLRDFLNKQSLSVPDELKERLDAILNMVELFDVRSALKAGFTTTTSSPSHGGYSFVRRFGEALARNTNLGETEELTDASYSLDLTIEDQRGKKVKINFQKLPPPSVFINFESSYLDRLVRNLLRNAAQYSKTDPIEINIFFDLEEEDRFLVMHFKHIGSKIPGNLRRSLFRVPVRRSKGMIGIGLWSIGMAFEAQRLPAPKVNQKEDGVCFTFRFHVTKL